eukprot:15276544-Alexandrium_andersonii.AAC.1
MGAILLWRVREQAALSEVSPREAAAATRFLDSPDTWAPRFGAGRVDAAWGTLWPALAEWLALRRPARAPLPQLPGWLHALGTWNEAAAGWVRADAAVCALASCRGPPQPDPTLLQAALSVLHRAVSQDEGAAGREAMALRWGGMSACLKAAWASTCARRLGWGTTARWPAPF